MTDEAKTTKDHEEIMQWVEERGGRPAVVEGTENNKDGVGLLRTDFQDSDTGDDLKAVSWDDFFTTFDERNLSFLYQENTEDGEISRFFKFVED